MADVCKSAKQTTPIFGRRHKLLKSTEQHLHVDWPGRAGMQVSYRPEAVREIH
jgi:hypothetical protein